MLNCKNPIIIYYIMNLPLKYRPRTFKDVVGQEHIVKTLQNALKYRKIANAYLFTGQRGIGKTTIARIFAKGLNCINGPTPDPCAECEICKEIEAGNSLDVIEIDGASNRGIDQIRELRENVRFLPVKARYKVIIIDEVHMLTNEAFNALLKTLEEPPENVVFIFATTEPRKIPETVLSRVQRFDFRPLTETVLINRLKYICHNEDIECEDEALKIIYEASEGSMRDAISLLEQAYIYGNGKIETLTLREILGILEDEIFDGIFNAILAEDATQVLKILRDSLNKGYSLFDFHKGMVKATSLLLEAVLLGYKNRYSKFAEYFSEIDMLYMFKILKDMEQTLKLSNYPRALFEYELVKLAYIKRISPLSVSAQSENRISYHKDSITQETDTLPDILAEDAKKSKMSQNSIIKRLIKEFNLKEVNDGSV